MDTTILPVLDNATDVTTVLHNISSNQNIRTVTFRTPKTMQLILNLAYTIGVTAGVIGIIANAVVITVLVKARRQHGSNVNTLIINQSIVDLLACCFVVVTMTFIVTDSYVYNGSRSQFVDKVICIFLDAGALTGVFMTGEKIGLVVITLNGTSRSSTPLLTGSTIATG